MKNRFIRLHALVFRWRSLWSEEMLALLLVLFVFVSPVAASTRFQERSLLMHSAVPAAETDYTLSLRFVTPTPVGSLDMLFCIDPIPHHACVTPPGLDVSGAVLSDQSGETGFSISYQDTNHIILSRLPTMISGATTLSSYKFENIINPTDTTQSFSIRLRSHSTIDATGPQIDFGSVKGQVTRGIVIETQVPPMLVFCLAQEVSLGCTSTNDTYYSDMGELSANSTLTAQSQMAVGTNASAGFAITANGEPPSSGTNVIDPIDTPSMSQQGTNQFGINLVANSAPDIGDDPMGAFANAVPSPEYNLPDHYKYKSGDVIAYSPNVSLMRKFTVSYVINSSENLRPGVYSTTITYIATGQF